MTKKILLLIFVYSFLLGNIFAKSEDSKKDSVLSEAISGLKFRSIGPAYCSGRISDFAVNPNNHAEYYIAVASGNIWKTTNSGTTFDPIFDNYGSYSIGCLAIDPNNPYVIWAGTGENNHQRALGYGDGVYKSTDAGNSWNNVGLKESRQIGEIVIDPRNSNIIFVAAEGSVWGPGGERGLYKSKDGGKIWNKVLDISDNTGVNCIVYDPRNPDVMYATSEQRRRHVYTKIGGGPESAVYKSEDGGETLNKIMSGLPNVHIGGMDIAVSPVNPDVIYLIMEAAEDKGGFFKSTNRGASWEKMNEYTGSGQYFNEIYCDPKNVDVVYSMDVVSKVTFDGGKTWKAIGLSNRHVDDHAMWIDPNFTSHFLIGGDGGIYETFDGGDTYDFKENLPITQFYRVNVDNAYPFYNVFGGTQDNNSMGGPSATISRDGIVNDDWFVTNGGDGFWTAVDPENENIIYAESQYGNIVRYDKLSGEAIDIRPEPRKGELTYKWNWNTPLFISPHKNTRIYCAANKVFKSDDRGETWEVISEDLTRQIDRNTFTAMGKYWSIDAVSKDKSTSLFGTIISLSESPVKENLIYAGTDDGLIQVSEDGKIWKKISDFPGVPEYTYVSDIYPSNFDENIVYATFDNILRDDFKPYVLKSDDKGKSWKSINSNLPENGTVHSIVQDFINPNLLFVGTEFGVFVSINDGESWAQLKNGIPVIAVKDIAVQKRESDLVLATFGRGFYILENYSPIRELSKEFFEKEAHLFPIKDALMYHQSGGRYGQGETYFKAANPEFGALFSYFVKDVPKTLKQIRKEQEKELFKNSKPILQPNNEEQIAEKQEKSPYLLFTIKDESGNTVRKLTTPASKGINRINWDLRYESVQPQKTVDEFNPTEKPRSSTLALPGNYSVSFGMVTREGFKELAGPISFKAKVLENTTLPAENRSELVSFQKNANELTRSILGAEEFLNSLVKRTETLKQVILKTPEATQDIVNDANAISARLKNISLLFNRDSKFPSSEENPPSNVTFSERLSVLAYTHWRSTSNITNNERNAYKVLVEEFPPVLNELQNILNLEIKSLEAKLEKLKAPYTEGRIPQFN